jgi:ribosome modulation factor
MNRREEQAFNDGKNACREGASTESCTRRNPEQRAAWMRGFEEQRRWKTSQQASDAQRAESRRVLSALKDAVRAIKPG